MSEPRTKPELARRVLPVCAVALDLPPEYFDRAFAESQFSFRLSHYPPVTAEANQFGIAPREEMPGISLDADRMIAYPPYHL